MKKLTNKAIAITLAVLMIIGLTAPATAADHPFSDVPDGAWFAEAVGFVYEHNIMGGVGNNRFDPQGHLTRAAVAALLFRVHNGRAANAEDDRNNDFVDVADTAWYAPYVTWAFDNSIVMGTSPTIFNPHGNITRQEFAVMVYRYAVNMTVLGAWSFAVSAQWREFTDRGQIARWAYLALHWMNFQGIMAGSTATTINPTGTATRAEAAVMMMRFVTHPVISLCPELVVRITHDWVDTLNANPPHLQFVFIGFGHSISDAWIDDYFGTYNGSVVLMINHFHLIYHASTWDEEVAGHVFRYRSGQRVLVWSDGVFYTLSGVSNGGIPWDIPGAFELGLLTAEDIESIYSRFERWQLSS